MEATISTDEFPVVGVRGAICDLYARDDDGDNLEAAFHISQDTGGASLDIHFAGEDGRPRVKVACCLIEGNLSIDVIDFARAGAEPCGADAVASATITVNPQASGGLLDEADPDEDDLDE
jgi:hypothetical protein